MMTAANGDVKRARRKGGPAASVPQALFHVNVVGTGSMRSNYLVSADGQRLLINKVVEKQNSASITVVLNWLALLKR